jgi:hypothetical protein
VEQSGPERDFIPLAERIEYYERRDAIEAGERKARGRLRKSKKPGRR